MIVVPTARIWSATVAGVPLAVICVRNRLGSAIMKRDWLRISRSSPTN